MHKVKNTSTLVLKAVISLKQEIDDQPLKRKSIPKLISKIHLGRNVVQESFKEITGKTIIRYQLEVRMEAASELLKESNMTIQQIAYKCGYKDQGNFSADFKKVFKETPSDWQRKYFAQN